MTCETHGAHPHAGYHCTGCRTCVHGRWSGGGHAVVDNATNPRIHDRPPAGHTAEETSAERTHREKNRPTVTVVRMAPETPGVGHTYVVGLGTADMQRAVATCAYESFAELVAEGLRGLSADEVERFLEG